jgi:hypothetical protein
MPQASAAYGTLRDKRITSVQFNCILVASLAIPFVLAGIIKAAF